MTDVAHVIGLYVQPEPCLGRCLYVFYINPPKHCNMIDCFRMLYNFIVFSACVIHGQPGAYV